MRVLDVEEEMIKGHNLSCNVLSADLLAWTEGAYIIGCLRHVDPA